MSDAAVLLVMLGALCLLFAALGMIADDYDHRDAKRRNGRG